jgi:alkylation response protein AidB-like acyl-CoA dehydrogenase
MKDFAAQQKIIAEAKTFTGQEIRPFAAIFEENEALPEDLIGKMARKGYLGATLPEEYGGLGLDPLHYGLLTEEIGKGCASTRALLTVHVSLVGETLLSWGNRDQKEKWLPLLAKGEKIGAFALTEPEVGTDAGSIQTSYRQGKGGFILNGRKKWTTFGDIADVFLVMAACDGKTTAFLVERGFAGVKTTRMRGLLASRAAHIAEIELNGVEVPAENVIGKPGNGFAYVANTALDGGRYSIAWAGVAIAQAALEEMVTYARKRTQFGQKIAKFQLIQGMIADATTQVKAARALCLNTARLRMEKSEEALIETCIAKYFASKVAFKVATDAVQIHGGNGCYNQYPAERLFRESKILEIIEGTSQIQQEIIANYGARKYYHHGTR